MKKPEEIKKGLEYCSPIEIAQGCRDCPYDKDCDCRHSKDRDALALIQQLEADNAEKDKRIAELEQELEAAKRERDAAVRDLESALRTPCASECDYCARQNEPGDMCADCRFEWRGVCPENTEVLGDG